MALFRGMSQAAIKSRSELSIVKSSKAGVSERRPLYCEDLLLYTLTVNGGRSVVADESAATCTGTLLSEYDALENDMARRFRNQETIWFAVANQGFLARKVLSKAT